MATAEDATERRNGTPRPDPDETGTTAEYVPLPEAARRLGISPHAVRRQLRAGQLRGRRRETPQGYRWMILLTTDPGISEVVPPIGLAAGEADGGEDAAPPDAARDVAPPDAPPDGGAAMAPPDAPPDGGGGARRAAGAAELVASQRAREMAEYTEALLQPWRRRVEALAGELGELRNELGHAQAERDAARAEAAAARRETEETVRLAEEGDRLRAAPPGERRPWWRLW